MACQWNLCWFFSIFGKHAAHTLDCATSHPIKAINNAYLKPDSCFWSLKRETDPPNVLHCGLIHACVMQMCADGDNRDICMTWFLWTSFPHCDGFLMCLAAKKHELIFFLIFNQVYKYIPPGAMMYEYVFMWNPAGCYLRKSWRGMRRDLRSPTALSVTPLHSKNKPLSELSFTRRVSSWC